MPDIERRIADWRRALAETAGGTDEVLAELESHLRDEVQRLVRTGEPEERALDRALSRLGPPQALAAEFAKLARDGAATWLPVRLANGVLLALAAALVGYCACRLQDGRLGLLLASHVVAVTLGYGTTLLVGGLAFCYVATRSFDPPRPAQIGALTRAVLVMTWLALAATTLGVFLGGVWAKDNLGRFWGWDLKETGGAIVLAWDGIMILFCWRRPAATHAAMLLAFAGNVVVAAAWFGPGLLAVGLHVYGPPVPTVTVIGFVTLAHVAMLALGLAPAGWLRRAAISER